MTRKKKEEVNEPEVVEQEVVVEEPDPVEEEKEPGGVMFQPVGEAMEEGKSIRRDCARGEHDGEVVLKEGKGGLGMPEVRVCERCAGLFVRKA